MDRKPALTKKVIRGFAWISMMAQADLDTAMSDEIPSLTRKEEDDVSTALGWMSQIRTHYKQKAKQKRKPDET